MATRSSRSSGGCVFLGMTVGLRVLEGEDESPLRQSLVGWGSGLGFSLASLSKGFAAPAMPAGLSLARGMPFLG